MAVVTGLSCVLCGSQYGEAPSTYNCPNCGELGTLRVSYDPGEIRGSLIREQLEQQAFSDHWRYLSLLPLRSPQVAFPLRIGGTPLYEVTRVREKLGLPGLWVKDDSLNPSGSLKDRASALVLLKGQELGCTEFATASTGNAGASLACLCAALGRRCHIFVPASAPRAKLAQLLIFGADVLRVQGSYSEAFSLCVEACRAFGWYNRNTGYNPYTVEGKKTVAFEIAEQLSWSVPDVVVVPAGDGCLLSGVWKGFVDLHRAGLTDRLPRLIAAQAEGSQAIRRAFEGDGRIRAVEVRTLADSIAVALPRNGAMAVQDLKASGGMAVAVTDREILRAMALLGELAGIFGEPAAVASLAAVLQLLAREELHRNDRITILMTGSGLKDIDSALDSVAVPPSLPCNLSALRERMQR